MKKICLCLLIGLLLVVSGCSDKGEELDIVETLDKMEVANTDQTAGTMKGDISVVMAPGTAEETKMDMKLKCILEGQYDTDMKFSQILEKIKMSMKLDVKNTSVSNQSINMAMDMYMSDSSLYINLADEMKLKMSLDVEGIDEMFDEVLSDLPMGEDGLAMQDYSEMVQYLTATLFADEIKIEIDKDKKPELLAMLQVAGQLENGMILKDFNLVYKLDSTSYVMTSSTMSFDVTAEVEGVQSDMKFDFKIINDEDAKADLPADLDTYQEMAY